MIDDIGEDFAIINIDDLWVYLSLQSECKTITDDNYFREFTYKSYTPIITAMHGLTEDGKPYALSDDEIVFIKDAVDCDEFYDAYQELFDDELTWGQNVESAYFSR